MQLFLIYKNSTAQMPSLDDWTDTLGAASQETKGVHYFSEASETLGAGLLSDSDSERLATGVPTVKEGRPSRCRPTNSAFALA
jgi:hypothetical protein